MTIETWEERRAAVEGAGLGFAAAEEYRMFPPPDPDSPEGAHAAEAARALMPLLEETQPDAVVSDILTLAPTLAAEAAGVPLATLIPHIYPVVEPGLPFFAVGLQPPRTPLGRARLAGGAAGARHRPRAGPTATSTGSAPASACRPSTASTAGSAPTWRWSRTFPQLEYPRRWPTGSRSRGR